MESRPALSRLSQAGKPTPHLLGERAVRKLGGGGGEGVVPGPPAFLLTVRLLLREWRASRKCFLHLERSNRPWRAWPSTQGFSEVPSAASAQIRRPQRPSDWLSGACGAGRR